MAASIQRFAKISYGLSPSFIHPLRLYQRLFGRTCASPFCKDTSLQDDETIQAAGTLSRYMDRPLDYLESEEYINKYGASIVWAGYRRNHKGGIPPQRTRKTCTRGNKICGNPCPICRDPNIIVHYQNVKLLQQFISPHTGLVYDPTRTGVCMKQQKKLKEAIRKAQDNGFLLSRIPHVEFSGEDFSNSNGAVGSTPPPPFLSSGDTWYNWYRKVLPAEQEVAKVRKSYKAYLS